MKIYNLVSDRSGRPVANQFVAYDHRQTIFQSYESTIVMMDGIDREIIIGRDWDYSQTTRKYLYQFMSRYAPVVNFAWNKDAITKAIVQGYIEDFAGRRWVVRYDESLA